MKQYELLVVLPGTMEETIVSDMVQQVKTIVEKHGGENITMQDRGKSRLAYPIKHIRYGYFHIVHFTAEDGSKITQMQQELSLIRDILRAIITTFDPKMRAETQKKLGRTEEGPMKTLASVFERFGGETKGPEPMVDEKKRTPRDIPTSETKEETVVPIATNALEVPVEKSEPEAEEATPIAMEDIDKKLDQLLEDDLKQV
ncbi:MAG: 30S ribosomal protein S6 [Candidatus Magasanikbacteria bacterium CG1_02_41_34]|uniref:Small ribosomal subunit protein bS6 n=1 Tax=Candidatus Magasanikbacteria bacterium CG_4_10_14_0_2_um_filter_41_31 TaxID=1974639 RepID=A0A2M7V2W5_9BACT|nr:MAG: 30S ribosomal protein S6 [Candidatus Magasanikbacteria bacterium CG1_02_41_34]PIZ92807.1 MAG: 30S ribosomal protein S6 [Candidatus Magasanikbacteria bacterium CG_4_10_14_0_2_um_filter_41_31]